MQTLHALLFPCYTDFMKSILANTIKIAVAAILAILCAQALKLDFAVSAGIVAILSVQPTKKETLQTALARLLAFAVAAKKQAEENFNNQFSKKDTFDTRYLEMREKQTKILYEMYKAASRIKTVPSTAGLRRIRRPRKPFYSHGTVRRISFD